MDHIEQENEFHQLAPQGPDFDEAMNQADDCSISGNSNGSEAEDRDISQAIVAEMQNLLDCGKIEIIGELVKSRILQARFKKQVDILQMALEDASAEKAKLQLELANNDKITQSLHDAAQELGNVASASTGQYNTTIDMIAILDMKRLQLIKDTQAFRSELAQYKEKIEQVEQEMQQQTSLARTESERNNHLQAQVDKLLVTNNDLRQEVENAQAMQQSLTSSHSVQLTEIEIHMTKLNNELNELQRRLASEVQKNTALKQNADLLLIEKTQYSTEIVTLETKLAEMVEEMESKLENCNAQWQARYDAEMNRTNKKYVEANKCLEEATEQVTKLEETIEKMKKEQSDAVQKHEQEKCKIEEMGNKVGGMQAILEDRNNEIYSLHAKLNGEQKKFDDQKQQFQLKLEELQCQIEHALKESEEKASTILQLQEKISENLNKISSIENQVKEKEEECSTLRNGASEAEQLQVKISHLELALTEKTSKVASLEHQLRASKNDKQTDTKGSMKAPLAHVTSTPLNSIDLNSNNADASSKKIRLSENGEAASMQPSVSDYSTVQSSVQRKRGSTRFFQRVLLANSSEKQQQQQQQQATSNMKDLFDLIEDFDLSFGSTINIDDEPLDVGNFSSGSSVRLVKPFFRKPQDKK